MVSQMVRVDGNCIAVRIVGAPPSSIPSTEYLFIGTSTGRLLYYSAAQRRSLRGHEDVYPNTKKGLLKVHSMHIPIDCH